MHTTPTNTTTSRRRVVQGIAWAAPAVAMTAAAPAFAASKCTPTVTISGGPRADFGNYSQPTSNQQLTLGAQIDITGLPPGTTVTKVTEQWFVENPDGQTSTGNGYWFMGNSMTNWYKQSKCTSAGCSVQWTGPATIAGNPYNYDSTGPQKGWLSTVTNTFNGKATVFPDGKTYNAWDATLTWTNATGSGITTGTGGCNNFTTGPSGRFGITYYNAPSKVTTAQVHIFVLVTVYLSNGTTIQTKGTSTLTPQKA